MITRRWLVSLVATASFVLVFGSTQANATYPGANGRIALALDRGDGLEIYTMLPDGTDLQRLTNVEGSAYNPDWSPDGSMIVFQLDARGGTEGCRVELMNADGSDLVDLTGDHRCDGDPSFVPSGRRILFTAREGSRIKTMNLAGHDRRLVLFPRDRYMHSPTASPDGRVISVLVEREFAEGNRKAIFTVNRNGTAFQKIIPFRSDVSVRGADWSPSGARLAFSDQAGPTPVPGEPANINTIRPDGTGLRVLTDYTSPSVDIRAYLGSYSPDGLWIVFKKVNFVSDRFTVWKIRPDGTDLTLIRRFAVLPTRGVDWGPATI
jgi:Tol biopolymer transport system component